MEDFEDKFDDLWADIYNTANTLQELSDTLRNACIDLEKLKEKVQAHIDILVEESYK